MVDDLQRRAERVHDLRNNFFEKVNQSAIESSHLALRTVILINGGAATVVLAFIGGLASSDKFPPAKIVSAAGSLEWFAYGVTAAMLAMAFAYFTNYLTAAHANSLDEIDQPPFLQDGSNTAKLARIKVACHAVATLAAFVSLGFFVCGMLSVKNALTTLAT